MGPRTASEEGAAPGGAKHAKDGSPREEGSPTYEAPATAEPAAKKQKRAEGEGEEQEGAAAGGSGAAGEAEAGAGEEGEEGEEGKAAGGEQPGATGDAAEGKEEEEGKGKKGIIEQGRIQFLYRPKVGVREVGSLADVQRFFMMLRPEGQGVKSRLCVVGKKRLPSARRHERFFGFVEACAEDPDELLQGLGPKSYDTKTRGRRTVEGARAVGQGTYAIVEHKDHVTLVYKLEVPSTPGDAQLEFTIGQEGSFIFSVKNPAGRGPGDPGLSEKADFPDEKQAEFQHLSWIPARDPQLLEYKRCEFLLIGAREDEDVTAELGDKEKQLADASQRRVEAACGPESDEECLLESMREELQAEKHGLSTEPAETKELV